MDLAQRCPHVARLGLPPVLVNGDAELALHSRHSIRALKLRIAVALVLRQAPRQIRPGEDVALAEPEGLGLDGTVGGFARDAFGFQGGDEAARQQGTADDSVPILLTDVVQVT
eukprot:COSAG04_NODE_3472_length_2790_cov_0.897808_4_plen_113_part_00